MKELKLLVNDMSNFNLNRREFLRLGLISSLLGLSGCGIVDDSQIVRGAKNSLPEQLLIS